MKHLAYNDVFLTLRNLSIIMAVLVTFVIVGCAEDKEVATFIQANPTNGSTIQEDEDIIVTFDMLPAGLRVTGGEFSLSDTSVTITGPFTPGTVNIFLTWADGAQALTYTVEPIKKPITGSNIVDLVTGLHAPSSIALDVAGGKMYWIDEGKLRIQRSNLDGSDVETLITVGDFGVGPSIALDVAGGKMYWPQSVSWDAYGIRRANFDGTNVETLISRLQEDPENITLDVAGGTIYWTEHQGVGDFYHLKRANLDGSNVEIFVSGLIFPGNLALDLTRKQMYLTSPSAVLVMDLETRKARPLVSGLIGPDGIALDLAERKMYWKIYVQGIIQRSNLDGSNVEILASTGKYPQDLALDLAGGNMYWTESPGRYAAETTNGKIRRSD